MSQRRRGGSLCSGPGRLAEALGIRPDDDGRPFDGGEFSLTLPVADAPLLTGPRIGISRATDRPWRFGLAGVSGHSRPFPRS